ncbi:HAMP domain-containing sensor histidine kinase [Actinoplanes sp. NPDC026619]|uniref:HAMP domain-containing sensor histidine kinase n=1 Tax=Actinoplanes sp. NPDC026619 TaxID=3155798 RepID=UPI0033D9EB88
MSGWWRRRTLHGRVALLVTAAVSASLIALSTGAWFAVAEIQHHQTQSQLTADADAIAAQPDQWLSSPGTLPDAGHRHGPHQLGPRWQILDAAGAVISDTDNPLPVTTRARQVAAGRNRAAEEEVGDYLMLTVPATGGGAVQVAFSQEQDDDVVTLFGFLLAGGCLVGAAGAALLGRLVARSGLAPVQHLTAAVENVAVTMDLDQPLTVEGTDEIARLGAGVNTLLEAIDTARRAQRTLIEDASHELRTPLTSIRTNIELLLRIERHPELADRLPSQERESLLADLDAQIRELTTLTSELVELARAESTRETPEPVDLAEITEAALGRVRMRAPGIQFEADLNPAVVHGRPGELERMIVNVLDNAAKWSPPGSAVHLKLVKDDASGTCALRVADTGPGIDEADRPHVFERFYRATAARSMPGSGLGLAIVAQTVGQHGGAVVAEPNTPNGTVVTIRLPFTES